MKPTKCLKCGTQMVVVQVDTVHFRRLPDGRRVNERFRNVDVEECPKCGEQYYPANVLKKMDQAIDEKYSTQKRRRRVA